MAVYTVSQVTSYLKSRLDEDTLLRDIFITGEVANLARPGSGHAYFTLRDPTGSLRCVMFRGVGGAEGLAGGAAIIAHGRISVYEVRGEVQLIVDFVQPEGTGELQLQLEQLKLKLQNEGLFEHSRKRPIPEFPKKVAVVTSPTGAVWSDIQHVVSRRYALVELVLAPTRVQGAGASRDIAEALRAVNETLDVDVVILARGGGSLEELWPFNEEEVARAIYASHAPVISAVGHETDFTIADMVADLRAPTASAAAEVAVPDQLALATRLVVAEQALSSSILGHLSFKSGLVRNLEFQIRRGFPDLDTLRQRIDDMLRTLVGHLSHNLEVRAERFDSLRLRMGTLDPKDTLRRGYAIVQKHDGGKVISKVSDLDAKDAVKVTLSRGTFEASVISTHPL